MEQKSQRHEFLEMQTLVYEHATKGVVASIFSGPVSENLDIYGIMQELLCPEHISYIHCGRNSKFRVWMHLGIAECHVPFTGHCDLDQRPSFRIIMSWAYILYY